MQFFEDSMRGLNPPTPNPLWVRQCSTVYSGLCECNEHNPL